MKKSQQGTFSRILPKVNLLADNLANSSGAQWASGKIKRIRHGCGAVCNEIERLLGDPETASTVGLENLPHVPVEFSPEGPSTPSIAVAPESSTEPAPERIENQRPLHIDEPDLMAEIDFLWQAQPDPVENGFQLLSFLSGIYKAGFLFKRQESLVHLEAHFSEGDFKPLMDAWTRGDGTFPPRFESDADLRPACLRMQALAESAGVASHPWGDDMAFHFWLYPEEGLSVLLVSDASDASRRQTVLKTQSLIQRHFYD